MDDLTIHGPSYVSSSMAAMVPLIRSSRSVMASSCSSRPVIRTVMFAAAQYAPVLLHIELAVPHQLHAAHPRRQLPWQIQPVHDLQTGTGQPLFVSHEASLPRWTVCVPPEKLACPWHGPLPAVISWQGKGR